MGLCNDGLMQLEVLGAAWDLAVRRGTPCLMREEG